MYKNKNQFLECFKGKKVLVTGHTGFKGSWLAFLLQQIGADVCGYSLQPEEELCHFNILNLKNKINHIIGDITDRDSLGKVFDDFQPEFVFHLAAQALVKKSYDDPLGTYKTNVLGSANILDVVMATESVRSLVFVTSDKCYENHEWLWGYRETDQLGGHDPYSASKACAELIFSSHLKSFMKESKLGLASVRAGNVIGGGDWSANRVIPDCIRAVNSKSPINIRSPESTRPWQHVLEPLSGYLMLANRLYYAPKEYSSSWNFGPSISQLRKVIDLVTMFFHDFGEGDFIIENADSNFHEAGLLQLNSDKSRFLLDWSPRWNVEETVYRTAEWYRLVSSGVDAEEVTSNQIKEYFLSEYLND